MGAFKRNAIWFFRLKFTLMISLFSLRLNKKNEKTIANKQVMICLINIKYEGLKNDLKVTLMLK